VIGVIEHYFDIHNVLHRVSMHKQHTE